MANRPGRKTTDPAKNRIGILLTDHQIEMLDKCVYETRTTRTEIIRMGIEQVYKGIMAKEK